MLSDNLISYFIVSLSSFLVSIIFSLFKRSFSTNNFFISF